MTSLRRRVKFPSWSWLGWVGVVSLRVEERYSELGLEPAIQTYILRNSPLRLVRTSRVSLDNPSSVSPSDEPPGIYNPNAVTLQDLTEQHPHHLTPEVLANTPDDQLIVFWAETAWFYVSGLIKDQNPVQNNPLLEDFRVKWFRNILVPATASSPFTSIAAAAAAGGLGAGSIVDHRQGIEGEAGGENENAASVEVGLEEEGRVGEVEIQGGLERQVDGKAEEGQDEDVNETENGPPGQGETEEMELVGRTSPCDTAADNERGWYEFVVIATNEPPGYEKQMVCLQVATDKKDGIRRRVNIAEIGAATWVKGRNRGRRLVVLN